MPYSDEYNKKHIKQYNFDHPRALDFVMIKECMAELLKGNDTKIPIYNFVTHTRYRRNSYPH